jgi:hypothetical protein
MEPGASPLFQQAAKPRRRWLQYSLRTMLLLMVPVACVAASPNVQSGRFQGRLTVDISRCAAMRTEYLGGTGSGRIRLPGS